MAHRLSRELTSYAALISGQCFLGTIIAVMRAVMRFRKCYLSIQARYTVLIVTSFGLGNLAFAASHRDKYKKTDRTSVSVKTNRHEDARAPDKHENKLPGHNKYVAPHAFRKRNEMSDIRKRDPNAGLVLSLKDLEPGLVNLDKFAMNDAGYAFGVIENQAKRPELFEGRGTYYEMDGGRQIYVKGVGSLSSLDSDDTPLVSGLDKYPGFGRTKKDLFFDRLSYFGTDHPRTRGAETLRWGGLEFINAYLIFKHLVKKYQIKTLESARKHGLTIPLGVAHFPELSRLTSSAIRMTIKEEKHGMLRDKMRWQGNFEGLGSVALEVPSRERLVGGINISELSEGELNAKRFDPTNQRIVARTLRELLDAGFVYSRSGAHLQNIYRAPDSLSAQADNSDMVHLGTLEVLQQTKEDFGFDQTFSVRDQQIYLLYLQLNGSFAPPPLLTEAGRAMKKMQEKSEQVFYSELFGGQLIPSQITELSRLMPMFNAEIRTALAIALMQRADTSSWIESGREHRHLRKSIKDVNIDDEYQQKLKGNYQSTISYFMERRDASHDVITSFLEFIRTGDRRELQRIEDLQSFRDLNKTIDRDLNDRDKERVLSAILRINLELSGFRNKHAIAQDWYKNRGTVIKKAIDYISQDSAMGVTYIENLQTIYRNVGIAKRSWYIDSEQQYNPVFTYKDVLQLPEQRGLADGIERQKFIINSIEFMSRLSGGLAGVIDQFGDAPPKNIYDHFEDRKLKHPHSYMHPFFFSVYSGDENSFSRLQKQLHEYLVLNKELLVDNSLEEAQVVVKKLNKIAGKFAHPVMRVWHYNYLATNVFGRTITDSNSAKHYLKLALQELDQFAASR